ncbi:MAG TPA: 2-hydroxyacid dehydrogenase [Bosea sp. (in: a-proteobacteria)]|jgi:lactate dehydrogenase-like 2-hydroxyacid dehydrogenase|uniref:2-hydroxyacid dehydrogenase n=1 Tax=Bosea sp. (in: a-proteobacteria) TaxID=1871050 RepID=UPI002E159EE2|nr:2-hydroxyacid dehydrogenase [Bosea sp. (in: a-proteobacteria)]
MTVHIVFKERFPSYIERLQREFTVHDLDLPLDRLPAEIAGKVEVLVTSGSAGASRAEIAALPALKLICTVGTGYESIDLEAARERGIPVTHGAGINAPVVADHAMALLLAVVRDVPRGDAVARSGGWREGLTSRPMLAGKRLGVLGFGGIGQGIARRAAGFGMSVSYYSRSAKDFPGATRLPTPAALAEAVDFLICALPGDDSTFHLIGAEVFEALGSAGFFVNVGRGSTVDTEALVAALRAGSIAGAGLDVFENEPGVPESLRNLANVVLTPHVGGGAPEAQTLSAELIIRNIRGWFDGRRLETPVPEMRDMA